MGLARHGSLLALALAASLTPALHAQAIDDGPEWMHRLAIDPASPAAVKHAAQQRQRVEAEKSLKKIRLQHFGTIKRSELRQEGLVKLHELASPALFPSMVRIFEREGPDVKAALQDIFADDASNEGDAALAWMAVFDKDADVRGDAAKHLAKRREKLGETPVSAKLVVFEGLRSQDEATASAAARFAAQFDIIEAIPWLIAGQLQGTPQVQNASIGDRGNGALAWIMVGTQTAYVSDLQPVVGPSAVAFDPQLSVVNEGVILRVIDAVVVSYHVDIHNALIDLTSRSWGQSTDQLGWNVPAWRDWYTTTYQPYIAQKQAELAAAKASGKH